MDHFVGVIILFSQKYLNILLVTRTLRIRGYINISVYRRYLIFDIDIYRRNAFEHINDSSMSNIEVDICNRYFLRIDISRFRPLKDWVSIEIFFHFKTNNNTHTNRWHHFFLFRWCACPRNCLNNYGDMLHFLNWIGCFHCKHFSRWRQRRLE